MIAIAFAIWHRWHSYRPGSAGHDSPGSAATASWANLGRRAYDSVKVPAQITAVFWAIKLLSTAMGEAFSDALVHGFNKYGAVVIGFLLFIAAMIWQLRARSYEPVRYWAAVCSVAVFGTMAADALHLGLGVPYAISSAFYAICLAVVLVTWYRTEGTLSIHSIVNPRREIFYWLTVLFTFALGTAVGDLTATPLHLGYFTSGVMFIGLFLVPGILYATTRANSVAFFWAAYILTRPLGASFADWLGFGKARGGLGWGHPLTAIVFAVPIIGLIAYTVVSRIDMPSSSADVTGEMPSLPPPPLPGAPRCNDRSRCGG